MTNSRTCPRRFATTPNLKTTILTNAHVTGVANLPIERFRERAASATDGRRVSLPRPEMHFHNDLTSPRQDTNFASAAFHFFSRVRDRVFKRGRPCEKRRSRRCSSANLPSETKGLNFDYL